MLFKSHKIHSPNINKNLTLALSIGLLILFGNLIIGGAFGLSYLFAQEEAIKSAIEPEKEPIQEPIIVNGDKLEYSTDAKDVNITGNVVVIYKGDTLTCDRLFLNTETKEAIAEGNARLDDQKGIIEGSKIIYNLENKTGIITDSDFRSNPYFGKSEKVRKISETEFLALIGYATTCSFDKPHYRIASKEIRIFPEDKIQTKKDIFYLGEMPIFYLPRYNHSLKDPFMHVRFIPGKSKDWGPYLLSAWRYNINDFLTGRIYFDYRSKLGVSEGFGANYATEFGKGDFQYYYTQERSRKFEQDEAAEFQRYLIRLRHKWDIDEKTDFTTEYYKIVDSKRVIYGTEHNILKDYFPREYEKDSEPLSYALFHHNFDYSTIDILAQKRTNRWYTQLEKLPEIKYSMPGNPIGETPFYLENETQTASYNYKYAVPSPSSSDIDVVRFDTVNKISLPSRVAFISFTPFIKNQETFYNKNVYGASTVFRSIFYSGADASTKFYRIFNVKTNAFGLNINGLRHIITPTIAYTFNHEPTIKSSKLRQIDSIDSIDRNNSASIELSNKLQTKRNGSSIDIANFRIVNNYLFKPKAGEKRGSGLSDFLFEIDLIPYSWLRIIGDATYKHSGATSDANYKHISNINYDINFDFGQERSFGVGQRYQRKGGNEMVYNLTWRLSPKWKFSVYQRHEIGHDLSLKRGLREQEYVISRDLHCWIMDFTYNIKRGEGETIWFIFKLKAFPELAFEFNRGYHSPKPGSQSNP